MCKTDSSSLYSAIFDNDNFTPLTVETEDQYHAVVELFPYEDISLSRAEFPKSFPFSGFVHQIYQQVSYLLMCMLHDKGVGKILTKLPNLILMITQWLQLNAQN